MSTPRLPGRHDQPVTPLEMSEADAVAFAEMISSGMKGQAPWRRACSCRHPAKFHVGLSCGLCSCKGFKAAGFEVLLVDLHPDAVNYLPPDVRVLDVGNRPLPIGTDERGGTVMGYKYLLARDYDDGLVKVVRSGVREETTVYTSPPEEER